MKKATKNILAGFFAGAAAGVLTGILLAPAKGSETREKISEKAQSASDDISKTFAEKLEELKQHLNKAVIEVLEKVKSTAEKMTLTPSREKGEEGAAAVNEKEAKNSGEPH